MDFSNLLQHPNKDEIIDQLIHGKDPKEITNWLKLLYPDKEQSHLRLTQKILQDFVKSKYMDYSQQFSQDLIAVQQGVPEDQEKKISDSLLNNKTYRQRMEEYAQQKLEPRKEMVNLIYMIRDRAEQVFDRIQDDPSHIGKGEYALINWCEKLFNALEKLDKMENQTPDKIIQHNINIQAFDQRLSTCIDAIRETLAEIDPEASLLFIEKWNQKSSQLEFGDNLLFSKPSESEIIKNLSSMTKELILE